ncbi:MAG: hypothetical protein ACK4WM_05365 [Thermoflexales bacterium]
MADILHLDSNLDKAARLYWQSLKIAQDLSNREGEAKARGAMGKVPQAKDEHGQAIAAFQGGAS